MVDISNIQLIPLIVMLTSMNSADTHSFAITLPCIYRTSNIPWPILGEIYECYIEHDIHITHPQMPVANASGNHKRWKNDGQVAGFYARSAEVLFFPNGLEKIFPNLKLIAIAMSGLKEVRQKSLMAFDQLQYLCLFDNSIETIEKHLFAYNILLEAIDLRENRILKINVNVFDYLINLRILYTSDAFNSSCVSIDAGDRESVVKLVSEIKKECNDRAIFVKTKKVTNLIKKEEDKMLNLTNSVVTERPKDYQSNSTKEDEKLIEIVTEAETNEEENDIEDEFRASAVSAGSFCYSSNCFIVVILASIILQ